MEWTNYLVSILAGLAATIPLVVQLVKYVQASIRERNWTKLLDMVVNLMKQAEAKFDDGADKKEWCLMMIKASADNIDYEIDIEVVGKMIDDLCNMSNVVNPPSEKSGE